MMFADGLKICRINCEYTAFGMGTQMLGCTMSTQFMKYEIE